MNKFLALLLSSVFTVASGSAAFAADAVRTTESTKIETTEPATVEITEPAKVNTKESTKVETTSSATESSATPAPTVKKHRHTQVKKVTTKSTEESVPADNN